MPETKTLYYISVKQFKVERGGVAVGYRVPGMVAWDDGWDSGFYPEEFDTREEADKAITENVADALESLNRCHADWDRDILSDTLESLRDNWETHEVTLTGHHEIRYGLHGVTNRLVQGEFVSFEEVEAA